MDTAGDTISFWTMLGSGTALLVHLAMQVVWLVVVLTVVRKASPRGALLAAIGIGLQIILAIAAPFVVAGLGVVSSHADSGGMAAWARLQAVWTIVGAVLGAGISGLLLAGVVRVAQDRKRDVRDPDLAALKGD